MPKPVRKMQKANAAAHAALAGADAEDIAGAGDQFSSAMRISFVMRQGNLTQQIRLARRGGIEPPAFILGRQLIYEHVYHSFGLEVFLARAPQECDSAPNICQDFCTYYGE